MVTIPKNVGLMSCGFLLCLGLSNAAQAGHATSSVDEMNGGQSDHTKGGPADQIKGGDSERGKTIKGEVLRVESNNYVVTERIG